MLYDTPVSLQVKMNATNMLIVKVKYIIDLYFVIARWLLCVVYSISKLYSLNYES